MTGERLEEIKMRLMVAGDSAKRELQTVAIAELERGFRMRAFLEDVRSRIIPSRCVTNEYAGYLASKIDEALRLP